jgi:hypothetical protein
VVPTDVGTLIKVVITTGYYSYVTGEAEIMPALTNAELKDAGLTEDSEEGEFLFDEHLLTPAKSSPSYVPSQYGTRIRPRLEEAYKTYYLEDNLKSLVKWCMDHGHVMNGMFHIDGESKDDIWRMHITNNVVDTVRPKLIWPNGSEGW